MFYLAYSKMEKKTTWKLKKTLEKFFSILAKIQDFYWVRLSLQNMSRWRHSIKFKIKKSRICIFKARFIPALLMVMEHKNNLNGRHLDKIIIIKMKRTYKVSY